MINIPKKKGRKSKKDLEQLALLNQQKDLLKDDNLSQQEKENKINELKESADLLDKVVVEEIVPKKRGRKPRGGKIVPINSNLIDTADLKQNVILHLKCNLKDLNKLYENKLESFNFNNQKNELKYDSIFYDKIKSDEYNGETFFGKIIENEIIDNKENNNDDSNQSNNLTDKNIDRLVQIEKDKEIEIMED